MKDKIKVVVKTLLNGGGYGYKCGDIGYIDGYVQYDKETLSIVIIGDKIVSIPIKYLEIIDDTYEDDIIVIEGLQFRKKDISSIIEYDYNRCKYDRVAGFEVILKDGNEKSFGEQIDYETTYRGVREIHSKWNEKLDYYKSLIV